MADPKNYNLKGRNELVLNNATAMAAFQLWVDTYMVGQHTVVDLGCPDAKYGCPLFTVVLESAAEGVSDA